MKYRKIISPPKSNTNAMIPADIPPTAPDDKPFPPVTEAELTVELTTDASGDDVEGAGGCVGSEVTAELPVNFG